MGYGFGMGVVFTRWKLAPRGEFAQLSNLQQILSNRFDGQIDIGKLLEGAKAGLVGSTGDPYTAYLTAEEARQLDDDLSGKLKGIGAEIGQKDGLIIVVAPLDGSPAQAADLRAGDAILEIDGKDTLGLSIAQAVLKIRGEEGSEVKLKIGRGIRSLDVTIKRAVITVPSVKWSLKDGVGYIKLSRFASDTGDKLNQAASELKAQGANSFLLDLRNNPGGYLDASVDVAGQFLAKGFVVVEERRGGKTEKVLKAKGGGRLVGVPLVVLINQGSASASEIVAGALQDHGKARIAGAKSFGKGSVQDLVELEGGSQLKVTIAHWFTPKGRGIDGEGIKPDVEIKQTDDGDSLSDAQLDEALKLLK